MDAQIEPAAGYRAMIDAADPAVFMLETETGHGDRTTMLKVQTMVAAQGDYVFAEVGSYMGGTLVPHLLDSRCSRVISIDKRPDLQPDERGVSFDYTRSSTAKMIERLRERLPSQCLDKLQTFDCDASDLLDTALQPIDMCFIDGEHTNKAAFRDFLSLWKHCKPDCIILFHDANLISDGICNVEALLDFNGVEYKSYLLPELMFAVFIGKYAEASASFVPEAFEKDATFARYKDELWKGIARTYAAIGLV